MTTDPLRRALALIDDDRTVGLLRRFIATPSFDPPGDEAAVAGIAAAHLRAHGIAAELVEVLPGRPNLLARIGRSRPGRDLAYCAHFDTIPVVPSAWSVPPFQGLVQGGRIWGRGATDMKSGMAAMIEAAIAVAQSGAELDGALILAFTVAENTSCAGAEALLRGGHLATANALLISEPSSLRVFTAEKGALWLEVEAKGEYGHNSTAAERSGDRGNAILRLAAYLTRLGALDLGAAPHPLLGPATLNVGVVRGGISPSLIPDRASALVDVRMLPGMSAAAVLERCQAIGGPHIAVRITAEKPPVETPASDGFVRDCLAVAERVTGRALQPEGVGYYSDGAVLVPALGIPMVIIGPGDVGRSGAVDESCDLGHLAAATRIFTEIALRRLM